MHFSDYDSFLCKFVMITQIYLSINFLLQLCVNVVVYNRDYFKKFLDMYKDLEIEPGVIKCIGVSNMNLYGLCQPFYALVFLIPCCIIFTTKHFRPLSPRMRGGALGK